jgi:hypothetical protein
MAQPATIVVTSIEKPDLTRRKKVLRYAITMADPGSPTYPAGGVVVNISYANVVNGGNWERAKWDRPTIPKNTEITPDANLMFGYGLSLQQGATSPTMANFVLRIYTSAGTELGTGSAIPSALFAAAIANSPQLVFLLRSANYF